MLNVCALVLCVVCCSLLVGCGVSFHVLFGVCYLARVSFWFGLSCFLIFVFGGFECCWLWVVVFRLVCVICCLLCGVRCLMLVVCSVLFLHRYVDGWCLSCFVCCVRLVTVDVCYVLRGACCVLCLFVVEFLIRVVCCLLFVVYRLLIDVCCLLVVVGCSLFVVCCLF